MGLSQGRALGLSLIKALVVFSTGYVAWVSSILIGPLLILAPRFHPQTQYYAQWLDVLQFALVYMKALTMPKHWDPAWRIAEILCLLGEGPASLCDLDQTLRPMDSMSAKLRRGARILRAEFQA